MSKVDFTTATEIMWPGQGPYEGFAREEVTCQHDGSSSDKQEMATGCSGGKLSWLWISSRLRFGLPW